MSKKLIAITGAALLLGHGAAWAEGDVEKGKSVFKRCAACHVVDAEKNKAGPHLVGIIDRKAGVVEGFNYSKPLMSKAEEGLVWDKASLDKYLEKPKDFIPKGKMAFAGLSKPEDRVNIIAYLEDASKPK